MMWTLPDKSNWRFDKIESSCPERASALESAACPDALLKAVEIKFESALRSGDVRVGHEHAEKHLDDFRAVVQFKVGRDLFDSFFNARTGYRAHFRSHYKYGLRCDSNLIARLRLQMEARFTNIVRCRELDSEFHDCGEACIARQFFIDSCIPYLSKVWRCGKLLRPSGGEPNPLPSSFVGEPRILLDGCDTCPSFFRDEGDAWLDIKGAFLKPTGKPYQPKGQFKRAKKLHTTGTT